MKNSRSSESERIQALRDVAKAFSSVFKSNIPGFEELEEDFEERVEALRRITTIGGGELAVEITLAGFDAGWNFRNVNWEPFDSPMRKMHELSMVAYLFDEERKNIRRIREPHSMGGPTRLITALDVKESDAVVLEDYFLNSLEWAGIQIAGKKDHGPQFIPSAQGGEFKLSNLLSRTATKEYVREALKDPEMTIESYPLPLADRPEEAQNQIEECFSHTGSVILKPDITSSGHGMYVLKRKQNIDEIHSILGVIAQDLWASRHPEEEYVAEPYLDGIDEYFVIVAKKKPHSHEPGYFTIGPIQYKKYSSLGTYSGPFRLEWSRFPPVDRESLADLEDHMVKCSKIIAEFLRAEFLGVEFLVDKKKRLGRDFYVNEVTWRPDDSGMVSMVSHSRNQFQLFVDTLGGERLVEPQETSGVCISKPILRRSPWPTYSPEKLAEFNNPAKGQFLRIYQKGFSERPEVAAPRVMGYYAINEDVFSHKEFEKMITIYLRELEDRDGDAQFFFPPEVTPGK